jgi:hypothetical protein
MRNKKKLKIKFKKLEIKLKLRYKLGSKFVFSFFFFFFFLRHVHIRVRWKIQTSDLRFMSCGPKPIELSLEKQFVFSLNKKTSIYDKLSENETII